MDPWRAPQGHLTATSPYVIFYYLISFEQDPSLGKFTSISLILKGKVQKLAKTPLIFLLFTHLGFRGYLLHILVPRLFFSPGLAVVKVDGDISC